MYNSLTNLLKREKVRRFSHQRRQRCLKGKAREGDRPPRKVNFYSAHSITLRGETGNRKKVTAHGRMPPTFQLSYKQAYSPHKDFHLQESDCSSPYLTATDNIIRQISSAYVSTSSGKLPRSTDRRNRTS